MRLSLQDFITTWDRSANGRGLVGDDIMKAGYPNCDTQSDYNSNLVRESTYWHDYHVWCDKQFGRVRPAGPNSGPNSNEDFQEGQEGYTWSGSIFYFNNEYDRDLFRMKWLWELDTLRERFPYAIEVVRPGSKYIETDDAVDFVLRMKRLGTNIDFDNFNPQIRWCGLKSGEEAFRARMILPDRYFVKFADYKY